MGRKKSERKGKERGREGRREREGKSEEEEGRRREEGERTGGRWKEERKIDERREVRGEPKQKLGKEGMGGGQGRKEKGRCCVRHKWCKDQANGECPQRESLKPRNTLPDLESLIRVNPDVAKLS